MVLYDAGSEGPATHQEQRSLQLRYRVSRSNCIALRDVVARQLSTAARARVVKIDVALNLQIVDPQVDVAGSAVSIDHEQIDVCFGRIKRWANRRPPLCDCLAL